MKNEEKKPSYVLVILRRDNEHIAVLEDTNYDKVFEAYNEVAAKWASAIKDNSPFSLTSPVVTTFDPGLIYEIKINPVVETTASSKYENPYAQKMRREGLASMQTVGENLDQGYR